VPAGGGGLVAGVALAVKGVRPDVRIVAVQAEGAAPAPSLRPACRSPLTEMHTMADGIAVGCPGIVPLEADPRLRRRGRQRLRGVHVPSAAEPRRARQAGRRARRRCGGGRPDRAPTRLSRPVVALLSGGNIDPLLLGKVIRHGLASAGRFLNLSVSLPDLPGALNGLLTEIAAAQANIRSIGHDRTSSSLRMDEVEVRIEAETRGTAHTEALLARLRSLGYRVL
jgi:threonine dehydratase